MSVRPSATTPMEPTPRFTPSSVRSASPARFPAMVTTACVCVERSTVPPVSTPCSTTPWGSERVLNSYVPGGSSTRPPPCADAAPMALFSVVVLSVALAPVAP